MKPLDVPCMVLISWPQISAQRASISGRPTKSCHQIMMTWGTFTNDDGSWAWRPIRSYLLLVSRLGYWPMKANVTQNIHVKMLSSLLPEGLTCNLIAKVYDNHMRPVGIENNPREVKQRYILKHYEYWMQYKIVNQGHRQLEKC